MRRSPRATLALALGAVALAACEPVTAPSFPTDGPPTAFRVSFGGFGFGAHDVTLRGDTLVVTRVSGFVPDSAVVTTVVPSRADWAAFWRAADAAGVRAWPRECIDTRIADGSGYGLAIVYDGGRVASSGANGWPRRDGTCDGPEQTEEFRALLVAVSSLIGRPYP